MSSITALGLSLEDDGYQRNQIFKSYCQCLMHYHHLYNTTEIDNIFNNRINCFNNSIDMGMLETAELKYVSDSYVDI